VDIQARLLRMQCGSEGDVMKHDWRRSIIVAAIVLSFLSLPSCGADRKLTSITVTPQNVTLSGPGLTVQYTALGIYTNSPHPDVVRDITSQVVWQSEAPEVISIDSTGLATSQFACGTNIGISATVFSNPSNPSAGTATVGRVTTNVKQPPTC